MAYTPRTTAPSATDKHWIKTTYGGLNECILMSASTGSVLSNCVGYAWGRAYEILGERPKLSKSNAEDWYGNTADGYERGQTPRAGSIICWRRGRLWDSSDGAGHVAVVEAVYPDGAILTSNSNYKGTRFYTKRIAPPYNPYGGTYALQGFIYLPIGGVSEFVGEPDGADAGKDQIHVACTVLRARTSPDTSVTDNIAGMIAPGYYDVSARKQAGAYRWCLVNGAYWIAEVDGSVYIPAASVQGDTLVVDVSTWQDSIDWAKVSASGVKRAVIRMGYRGYGTGKLVQDDRFEAHYAGAAAAGLIVDGYFFTQAIDEHEAAEEAAQCVEWAKGKAIRRIYLDVETANNGLGRADGNSKTTWTAVALAFCAACKAAGYEAGVYANLGYMTSKLDADALRDAGCLLWLAHYTDAAHPEYREQYDMWQYTSTGKVDGIAGGVDLNRLYTTEGEPVTPDEPGEPTEPAQPVGNVTLVVGPVSGGDYAAIKRKAVELALHVDEPGGGVLTIGPMSPGDRASIEALAARLGNIGVEVVEEEPDEPMEPEQPVEPTDAERINALRAEVERLTAAMEAATTQIAQLNAKLAESRVGLAKYKAATEAIRAEFAGLD